PARRVSRAYAPCSSWCCAWRARSEIADGDANGVELFVGQLVLVVPIGVGFGGRQPLALHGVADECGGLSADERHFPKRVAQRSDVVAVQLLDGKAKTAPLVRQRLQRQ